MALTVTHPAHAVLSPGIARTTEEFVALNAITGWILSIGLVVAPAAAGLILAASGTGTSNFLRFWHDDGDELVVTGGKLGYVFAIDRDTGEEVWKASVGVHNGHDDDSRKQLSGTLELPVDALPGVARALWGRRDEPRRPRRRGLRRGREPPGSGQQGRRPESAGARSRLRQGTGELVRLDLATGEIDRSVELDTMPLGAMTISNDLLFTTLFDGRLIAHSIDDGSEVWSPGFSRDELARPDRRRWLVTAAGFPKNAGQTAELVVIMLNR